MRIYAHRGASRELLENTLPAFRRALELGADALETDVHQTRDGHLVVSHDPDCARVFGVACAIAQSTLAEVRAAGAQLPVSLARRWVVKRCHALGLRVDFWTVNDPAQARHIAALGADGIMTDDPAAIVPALRPR